MAPVPHTSWRQCGASVGARYTKRSFTAPNTLQRHLRGYSVVDDSKVQIGRHGNRKCSDARFRKIQGVCPQRVRRNKYYKLNILESIVESVKTVARRSSERHSEWYISILVSWCTQNRVQGSLPSHHHLRNVHRAADRQRHGDTRVPMCKVILRVTTTARRRVD